MADETDDQLAVKTPAPPAHLAPLLDGIERLYASKDYADVTIKCQGQEFKAHKFLLCAQSDFFQSTFGGNFKEAKENEFTADDDSAQVLEALIHYFYTFDYGEYTNRYTDVSAIVLDVKMHAIADKYFVGPLKELSAAKFEARAKEDWCTPEFADAVAEIHETTLDDEPIRLITLETIRANSKELLKKADKYAAFHKVLREVPDLGADLATSLDEQPDVKTLKCPSCSQTFQTLKSFAGSFSCPNFCVNNQSQTWWSGHEITD